VLLTTILGYCITSTDKGSDDFEDTPTALKTVFGRMDTWLQMNLTQPAVNNPFLASENFAEMWTPEQSENSRDKIHTYREWIDDAYNEQDRGESIAKWRRVFGHDFAKGEVLEEARSVTKSAVALLKSSTATAALFQGDLVDAVRRFGFQILPARFYRLPHMDKPKWKQADRLLPVQVNASLHRSEGGQLIGSVRRISLEGGEDIIGQLRVIGSSDDSDSIGTGPGPLDEVHTALEQAAERLYWEMENLDPSDGRSWADMVDGEREFYRQTIIGLVEGKGASLLEILLDADQQGRL
jgi:hypothetical protein